MRPACRDGRKCNDASIWQLSGQLSVDSPSRVSEDDGGDFEEGNDGGNGNNNDGNSGGNGGNSNEVELQSHEVVREDEGSSAESVKVEGEAENVSGGELSYAEVEVKFYEGDTLAESSLDNING